MKLFTIIIYFAVYSFSGWIIEVIYRSYKGGRFINPGFLHGPFVPVYGTGALFIILMQQYIFFLPLFLQVIFYSVVLSAIEYVTGELFERLFGLKLWDYSDTKFHIRGKVSLGFSLCWGLLAIVLSRVLHPVVSSAVNRMDLNSMMIISSGFTAYFIADTAYSAVSLNRFRRSLAYLFEKYSTLSSIEAQKIISSFKRILRAFPHTNRYLDMNLSENLKAKVNSMKEKLSETVESVLGRRKPREQEYRDIVADILEHEVFMQLRNYFHHNSSIYEHAKIVSYVSYKICRYLNLDYRSAARGGLLHDFFLYDWRNHSEPELAKEKFHGLEHPKIALNNSLKYFELNEVEKDIIIRHMWPLTPVPPRYQESFVVTFADKYVSSLEFMDEFRKKQGARIRKIAKKKRSGRA